MNQVREYLRALFQLILPEPFYFCRWAICFVLLPLSMIGRVEAQVPRDAECHGNCGGSSSSRTTPATPPGNTNSARQAEAIMQLGRSLLEMDERNRRREQMRLEEEQRRALQQQREERDAFGSGSCHTDLSYLRPRLPVFADATIGGVRSEILRTQLGSSMAAAKAQGYSASGAVDFALEQGREHDRVAREGATCAAEVDAWGGTDEAFLKSLSAGRVDRNIKCNAGIRSACLCAALVSRMSAVASRALAADMQCMARVSQW